MCITPESSFFRLLVPPFQQGVVGSYLVPGTWFLNYLPLKKTRPYPDFLVVTDDPQYPGYKTPTIMSLASIL
jgi:hypothetical protein